MNLPEIVINMIPILTDAAVSVPCRTQINHLFDSGERLIIFKDKHGDLWWQWRATPRDRLTSLARVKY